MLVFQNEEKKGTMGWCPQGGWIWIGTPTRDRRTCKRKNQRHVKYLHNALNVIKMTI